MSKIRNNKSFGCKQDALLKLPQREPSLGRLADSYLDDILFEHEIDAFARSFEHKLPPDLPRKLDGRQICIEHHIVTLKKQRVTNWKPVKPILSSNFFATPRHVDLMGNIVLNNSEQIPAMELMENVIKKYYDSDSAGDNQLKVGDPCIAQHDIDGRKFLFVF